MSTKPCRRLYKKAIAGEIDNPDPSKVRIQNEAIHNIK